MYFKYYFNYLYFNYNAFTSTCHHINIRLSYFLPNDAHSLKRLGSELYVCVSRVEVHWFTSKD